MKRTAYRVELMGRDAEATPQERWRYQRILLAEQFGWTLEYIDSLSAMDFADIAGANEGRARAQEFKRK